MNVNWAWFFKKYWKKFLVLIFLATVSTISFLLLTRNGAERIYSYLKGGSKPNPKFVFYSFAGKPLLNFDENWKGYLWFAIIFTVASCLLTALSYYCRNYLTSLVSNDLKQKSISKLYKLKEKAVKGQEKRIFGAVYHQSKELGNYFVTLPDILYVFLLTVILVFYELKSASGASIWAGLVYFFLTGLLSFVFNRLISQRKTELEKVTEEQTEAENSLINYRKLIVKKGLTNNFLRDYQQISQTVQKKANEETFFSSLYESTFDYLIRFGKVFLLLIILIFVPNASDFIIFTMFTKLTTSFGYLVKGVRKYPHYSSTQKRFNYFLNLPEKNDIQQNILISEPITSIVLQKIFFSYEKRKPVLKELNLGFEKGKINYLQAPNGFGKTTVVDLIFGLYQPNKGRILINNKYKLNELNLTKWREKIAYAEHENLIEGGLSTGQKQLVDLNNLFANSENKEIFIFDEADNALDENNKKEFRQKLEKISKKKLVVLVSC